MSSIKEKIETFSELAVIGNLELADRLTSAFEEMGIPILIEHITIGIENESRSFRISTQTQYLENAKRIADNMVAAYDTRKLVTNREKVA